MSPEADDDSRWFTVDRQTLFAELETDTTGLTDAAATQRLETVGPNRLPQPTGVGVIQIAARQFTNPLIYVLAAAAVVSVAIGAETDALFIAAVLLVNAVVGGLQEWRAEQSSRALQDLIRTRATVSRDGALRDIDAEELVPGDVVVVDAGSRVPADVRLIESNNVAVDESALTGESTPANKDAAWEPTEDTVSLGDRDNMAHAGTVVTRGRGRGVVVETGGDTVLGQLAEDVTAVEGGAPPLVMRVERFTRVVGVVVLVAAAVTAVLGVVVHGYSVVEMFLFAVALAVSAIPEGLPVGITVALGVASRRMAAVGVVVRRLVAVEGLGSCTMIASDKTGTLTANELTVTRIRLPDGATYEVTGEGYEPTGTVLNDGSPPSDDAEAALTRLARAGVLCNDGTLTRRGDDWNWRGDPVDVALLTFGRKLGHSRASALEAWPQVDQIPFESAQRYAASIHQVDGERRIVVKGAPERVLEMCTEAAGGSLDRDSLERQAGALAREGYRVLAVAVGTHTEPGGGAPAAEPEGLTLLGFLGLIDPLREGVPAAVAAAQRAGIDVRMVTGDHPETALAIARELGLATTPDEVVTGADLADATPATIAKLIETTRVFARVSPGQKLQIVEAARESGHYVAVTGDGVNDAPALQQANIGIAMGIMGTDVARDAADLVLSDDNFATIVAGIEQGRIAYDNVRKVVYLLISTGAGEVTLVVASLAAGLPLPLLPAQILWLNLVTNGIQDVALAFEPKEGDVLARGPRAPDERIANRLMIERTLVAAVVIGGVGFATFVWLLERGVAVEVARNQLLSLIVLFEIVNIGNARSETQSILALSPLRSPILLAGTLAAFVIHLGATYTPIGQAVLATAPIEPIRWVALGGLALTIAVALEGHTWSWRRRHSGDREDQ
mgnify:FL=1